MAGHTGILIFREAKHALYLDDGIGVMQSRKKTAFRIQMTDTDLEHISVWILGCEAPQFVLYLSSRVFSFYLFVSRESHSSPTSRFLMHVFPGCAAGIY